MHELSVSSAIVDTAVRHAEGRRVTSVQVRLGRLRQVDPGVARVLLRARVPRDRVRRRAAGPGGRAGGAALQRVRASRGRSSSRSSAARSAAPRTSRSRRARSWRSHPSRSRRPANAPREGQGGRGRARRQRDDRGRQPGGLRSRRRHRGQPDERSGRREDVGARTRPGRARRRARRRARGRRAGQPRRRPPRVAPPARDPAEHRCRVRRRVPSGRQHGPLRAARRCRSTTSTC